MFAVTYVSSWTGHPLLTASASDFQLENEFQNTDGETVSCLPSKQAAWVRLPLSVVLMRTSTTQSPLEYVLIVGIRHSLAFWHD